MRIVISTRHLAAFNLRNALPGASGDADGDQDSDLMEVENKGIWRLASGRKQRPGTQLPRRAGLHRAGMSDRPLHVQPVAALCGAPAARGHHPPAATGCRSGGERLHPVRRAVPDHQSPAQVLQLALPLARVRGAREAGTADDRDGEDSRAGGGLRAAAATLTAGHSDDEGAGAGSRRLVACARGLRLRRPHRAPGHGQLQVGPPRRATCCRSGWRTWTSPRRRRWSRRSRAAPPTACTATR